MNDQPDIKQQAYVVASSHATVFDKNIDVADLVACVRKPSSKRWKNKPQVLVQCIRIEDIRDHDRYGRPKCAVERSYARFIFSANYFSGRRVSQEVVAISRGCSNPKVARAYIFDDRMLELRVKGSTGVRIDRVNSGWDSFGMRGGLIAT